MTTTQRAATDLFTVPESESAEECIAAICTQRDIQRQWLNKITYENVLSPEGESYWNNFADAVDREVQYALALKDRMLREGRYFVETHCATALLDMTATSLTHHVPDIRRKAA